MLGLFDIVSLIMVKFGDSVRKLRFAEVDCISAVKFTMLGFMLTDFEERDGVTTTGIEY